MNKDGMTDAEWNAWTAPDPDTLHFNNDDEEHEFEEDMRDIDIWNRIMKDHPDVRNKSYEMTKDRQAYDAWESQLHQDHPEYWQNAIKTTRNQSD